MKITKKQLRRLVQEEMKGIVQEQGPDLRRLKIAAKKVALYARALQEAANSGDLESAMNAIKKLNQLVPAAHREINIAKP